MKRSLGVFVGFEWKKWRKFLALGFSKRRECVEKKKRAKPVLYIEWSMKDP